MSPVGQSTGDTPLAKRIAKIIHAALLIAVPALHIILSKDEVEKLVDQSLHANSASMGDKGNL